MASSGPVPDVPQPSSDNPPDAAAAAPPDAAAGGADARRLGPAVFLLSAATLALQVALVRVLSVSLWYSFAFLVVSTAILGVGISGMVLALWPRLAAGAVRRRVARLAAAFAAAIVGCFAVANALPFEPFRLGTSPGQWAVAPVYLVALLAPFFLSGLALGLIFTRFADRAPRLYGFDLVGAGTGAVAVVLAFGPFGGTGTVWLAAAVALGAAALLAEARPGRLAAAACALALAVAAPFAGRVLPVRITPDKTTAGGIPVRRLVGSRAELAHRWNALSRLDLVELAHRRYILIDGGVALTRLPRVPRPGLPRPPVRDLTTVAFDLRPQPTVLVLGSGGGFEVYGALTRGSPSVTAVELNPGIDAWVTGREAGYLGHLFADPRVHLHTAEARAFLRRDPGRYDVIVAAHTISNAATAAGALDLAESYTLTVEGVADALDHLTPRGLLYVTRPEAQLPKLVETARAVLAARGVRDPARHLLALRAPPRPGRRHSFSAGLIISRAPFDAPTVDVARAALAAAHLQTLYLPASGDHPASGPDAALTEGRLPRAVTATAAFTPATDDRPFFNARRRFTDLTLADVAAVLSAGTAGRLALEDAPVSEVSVAALLLLSIAVALVLTALPLWAGRRRHAQGRGGVLAYFGALGLAYLFVELGLVHALGLFIGPPTVTFAVVLGALLVTSGLGARLADRLPLRPRVVLWPALAVAAFAAGAPAVTHHLLGWPVGGRAVVAAVMVAPLGLLMGMPFPLGLRAAGARGPVPVALAWGVSGFAAVVASAGSVVIASSLGFTAVLAAGALAYLGAAAVLRLSPLETPA